MGPTFVNDLMYRGDLIPVISILMGGMFLIVITCGLMCLGFVKAITGGGSTRDRRKLERQETEAFQDLERGFRRMEERLDSLETLLIGQPNRPATDRELREL
ncbi:TPA: hypothetical protein EYO57_32730 [Candidatus Poribacteria bacterium]|nr:hypothetical protein [Candidatus Poribacteria bacterium]